MRVQSPEFRTPADVFRTRARQLERSSYLLRHQDNDFDIPRRKSGNLVQLRVRIG